VLDNLLSNSAKDSPKGGVVKLAAAAKPDKLEIPISDQGVGMCENQLDQIFDDFYRANTKDKAVQGLGLGMSIAKEIIEAHKGEIVIKSNVVEGTHVFHHTSLATRFVDMAKLPIPNP
jgi:two-component system sensor histidine kinase VicK